MNNNDYRLQHEVLIEYEGEELRFWLPEDRPFEQIIEALTQADPPPFKKPLPEGTYKLLTRDPKWGNDVPLDNTQTIRLSGIQTEARLKLVLSNQSTSRTAWLRFKAAPDGTNSIELGRDTLIGRGTETFKPDIDLTDFAHADDLRRISREHARIIMGPAGNYWLFVSPSPHGTFVNGRRIESGDGVKLEHGTRLSFVNVEATIEIFDADEDERDAG